jgi:hypothetical protein
MPPTQEQAELANLRVGPNARVENLRRRAHPAVNSDAMK